MDISHGIRQAIPLIVQNFRTNENSKTILNNLIREVSSQGLEVERLYLAYNLMQVLSSLPEADIVSFFAKVLPIPLTPNASQFMEQMVSLSVSLEKKDVLTAAAVYVQKEIRFPPDLECLPEDLAAQSAQFAAVVISRGFFTTSPDAFSPQLVAKWLHDLTECEEMVTIDAQKVIEYSLIGGGADHTPLHLSILKCIQKGKVMPIPGQFILSTGSAVAALHPPQSLAASDKFSQVLLVALESKLLSKFTHPVRRQLEEIFAKNEFICLLLRSIK